MNTCRFCKGIGEPLFKYGVRHYVHADCGFKQWGLGFLDKLHDWQIRQLPYRVVQEYNMLDECRRRTSEECVPSVGYPKAKPVRSA